MPRTHHRETYEGRRLLLPEVRTIGFDSHRSATDLSLHGHEHGDAYEVCLTLRGSVEWWVGDEVHESGPGDLYVTRPGERHGGVDAVIHPCDLYWAIIAAPGRSGWGRLPRGEARAVGEALAALRLRVFRASPGVVRAMQALLQEHRAPVPGSLDAVAARAALYDLVIGVVRDHAEAARGGRGRGAAVSREVREAMAWALARLDENSAVAEWADAVGLSPTRFHERFRAEVGLSPNDWRTRQRVRLAKRLLHGGELSVTEVAMRSGFATSQYFATVFKRLVGLAPGAYRAARSAVTATARA